MQGRRLLSVVSLLTIIWLTLAGCAPASPPTGASQTTGPAATPKPPAEQPKYGGVLPYGANVDEGTFDLHVTGRNLAGDQVGMAYSGLLQYDPEDGRKVTPDLAESYQISADGKKVTFRLRNNVKWHDDKPFSAQDVKFNFDRWMKPPEGVAITRKEIVSAVDRVETPDATTADVYLKYPSPFFIAGIATLSAVMLPPQYLKDHKTMEYTVLGTGPFKLKEYKRSVSLEFVKNETYFVPGGPYLDGVMQYLMPDQTARFSAFRTGKVRAMCTFSTNISATNAESLRKDMSDKVNVARFPGMVLGLVHLNAERPPFNDVRVRQAVDMALDRKKAIDVVEGRGEVSGPMIQGPWGIPGAELSQRPGYRGVSPADIEKAKDLLTAAGYPKGLQAEEMIWDAYKNPAVFVQDQLKAIGLDVTIKMVDSATMEKRWISRDFALSFNLPGQPIDEPDLYLAFYITGGGRNYTGYSDKQVDDWYQEQSHTLDPAKRKEIVLNIERKVVDQAADPVLYHQLIDGPYWKCLKGYYPEKQLGGYSNVKRQDLWLDDACR